MPMSRPIAVSVSAAVAEMPKRSPTMKSGRRPLSPTLMLAGIEWQSISTA